MATASLSVVVGTLPVFLLCTLAVVVREDLTFTDSQLRLGTGLYFVGDALVIDAARDIAWTFDPEGRCRPTPGGLYGRRKMTALVRRRMPQGSPGSVDRAMRTPALQGTRRSKGILTTIPSKDGKRAGDLLDRDFAAARSNRTWVMDFT